MLGISLMGQAPGAYAESPFHFVDVAGQSGVRFQVDNSQSEFRYQIEPMISGVALFDFDGDGLLDIYFSNGSEVPSLKKSQPRFYNRLFRNLGDLKFRDVTEEAGVKGDGYSMGVAAGDYDNDGWTDLYVTGVNRNILYHNLGDGTFEDVTEKAGVQAVLEATGKAWSVGAGWFDYDRDSDLDLFVVNYCVWSTQKDPFCGARKPGYRTYCHPKYYAPLPNILYRNNGDGSFTDVSSSSGIGRHPGKGMGVAFADFNRDGFLDIFVSNDTHRNFLFWNRGHGIFEESGLKAGVAYIDEGVVVSGMGADTGDYDGDGWIDIFMTALSNESFPLFRNLGNGLFRDERYAAGLGVQSLPWSGWSTGMEDLDNDGWLDLFVAGGHVQTNEELYSSRPSRQTNRVFRNLGAGSFKDVTSESGPGLALKGLHRGAAFGDLDLDGRVDIVATRLNEPVEILHNRSRGANHWIRLDLEGTTDNRQGLGVIAEIVLKSGQKLLRQSQTAVGYGGSSSEQIHFGLGGESSVEKIVITWPSGVRQMVTDPGVDRVLKVRQEAEPPK